MTNPTNPVSEYIRSLDGSRVPGGCDECDAYQVIVADRYGPNMHGIEVRHDDHCPWLAARS